LLIKLEDSSEDEWYRPAPSRHVNPGQGSSRWGAPVQSSSQQAPPPKDDGDCSDDSGDYTEFMCPK
jgi:hypothetical protein